MKSSLPEADWHDPKSTLERIKVMRDSIWPLIIIYNRMKLGKNGWKGRG